jgi:hypothetical protein
MRPRFPLAKELPMLAYVTDGTNDLPKAIALLRRAVRLVGAKHVLESEQAPPGEPRIRPGSGV